MEQDLHCPTQRAAFDARFASGLLRGIRTKWRLTVASVLLIAVAVFGVGFLVSPHGSRGASVVVPYPHELAQVSFAVAGDVIPHEAVRAAAGAAAATGAAGLGRAVQRRKRRLQEGGFRVCEP